MLSLPDSASVKLALGDPNLDSQLRVMLGQYASLDLEVFVVQGGDTAELINATLNLPITGVYAENIEFDWIIDHDGRWFEIAYGRTRIFVENSPAMELGIHYLCLSHLWGQP